MVKNIDGKQSDKYFKEYYLKNKERIQKRNKIKYQLDRNDPNKLLQIRERCTKWTQAYRKRHPERVVKLRRRMYVDRKIKAMLLVSKNGKVECNRCGCDELSFLEFNHINGGGCKEFKENHTSMAEKILFNKRKTDDLEIVCRVCNALDYLGRKNQAQSKRFIIKWW